LPPPPFFEIADIIVTMIINSITSTAAPNPPRSSVSEAYLSEEYSPAAIGIITFSAATTPPK